MDRSRIVADWKCRRAAYFQYEYKGKGLTSGTAAYELFMGTLIHDAAATIANFYEADGKAPIDDIAQAGYDQLYKTLMEQVGIEDYALEQAYLLSGLIRGYYKYAWPKLIESYPDILAIEKEILYEYNGCRFMAKPDLVMATGDGHVVYIELKSTSWINEKWLESWETNPQLHSCMKAINEQLGIEVSGAIIQGLYKGSKYKNQTTSPFCSAYYRAPNPPFQQEERSYTYKQGLKRVPLHQLGISSKEWVDGMSQEVLAEQFPQVPPVYYRDYLADAFFRQAAARRKEIEIGKKFLDISADSPDELESIMDNIWPQAFDQCKPAFGSVCQFHALCHEHRGEDPFEVGYQQRSSHHQPEIDEWASENS